MFKATTGGDCRTPTMSQHKNNVSIPTMRLKHMFYRFLCNICKDHMRGGVITICGHLFCWTCLWPQLANTRTPQCPYCRRRLILHEDIFPFLSEGPYTAPDPVIAQPGGVPRPTGMYLQNQQFPTWFTLHENEDTLESERVLSLVVSDMHTDYPRLMHFTQILEWFELLCVVLMCIVCLYMLRSMK
ncbi:hypothetical protein KR093_002237 [Drosophila rubida]|uniref:RING-type E3 ubiquitin transferase n=1 Tax=Drosophila rubida TaxID=30044 RepID=A0AAD4PHI6_9MUSC|nr:hypothetical protein KR093_002237 [Drosophila rubida]